MTDEPFYSNVRLDPDTFYFLYVGEIKTHCLNPFLQRGMERHLKRKVGHVSVVQDVLAEYPHENVLVVNPQARQFSEELDGSPRVALRVAMRHFAMQASRHPAVLELVQRILQRQKELPVWMFENKSELTLRSRPGVRLLGPDPALVHQCNDKSWQYDTFCGHVPTVDYRICCGSSELLETTAGMRATCRHGIFVSHTYSAGGSDSLITQTQEQVAQRFTDPEARYLVSAFIPHVYDPTVLGIVAGPRDVYIAGVADQRIEGSRFRGSTYPSVLEEPLQAQLREHTRTVGRVLGELGFRGLFGCDYIVDHDGRIFFIEVNPRKQGTTMEFTCALQQQFAPGAPSLIELEYHAVTQGGLPKDTPWPDHGTALQGRNRLYWGTYNYKVERTVVTHNGLPQLMPESELFRRVARGGPGGHLILEHAGRDTVVKPGTFLARAVAVDSSREGMQARLEQAIAEIEASFS